MKKSVTILMLVASISGAIFQSCTGKTGEKIEIPTTVSEPTAISKEDAAAATVLNLQAALKEKQLQVPNMLL